jgi:hypothetical protein
MAKQEIPSRQQLIEARADIQQQIELLQSGPVMPGHGEAAQFDPVIVKLTATLREIEDCLAEISADDA